MPLTSYQSPSLQSWLVNYLVWVEGQVPGDRSQAEMMIHVILDHQGTRHLCCGQNQGPQARALQELVSVLALLTALCSLCGDAHGDDGHVSNQTTSVLGRVEKGMRTKTWQRLDSD